MTRDDVVPLFQHMEWADSVIWGSIMGTESALGDHTVLERLHHVHLVQRIYLQMWIGKPERGRELSTFSDLSEVRDWARAYYDELRTFAGTIDTESLSAHVSFPWADQLAKWFGEVRPATVRETVVQVAMHTAHHRGQLATMIRQHGGEPPLVDFIGWVWLGKPEPAWESAVAK